MKRIATFLAASLLAFSAFGQNTRINERPISDTIGNAIAGTCSTANAVLYNASTPCSANLTFSTSSGNRVQVGSGSAALILGDNNTGTPAAGVVLITSQGDDNFTFKNRFGTFVLGMDGSGNAQINPSSSTGTLSVSPGGTLRTTVGGAAGTGLAITAGTAATNAPRALSISGGWTDGTSSNIGIVGNFDMGATGTATGKLLSLQAGVAGTTEVFSVEHGGQTNANIFSALTYSVSPRFVANAAGATFEMAAVADKNTAPTIASGGCTSPAVTWNNGTAAFLLTVGTSCTGVKTIVLTMPAATNLWAVKCENNTSDAAQQTNYVVARATSTTAVTLTSYDRVTGLQEDMTASDTYLCSARGG